MDFIKLLIPQLHAKIKALENNLHYYRTIADYTYDLEIFLDPSGKLLYINKAFERITGYSCEELINGKTGGKEIIHPQDLKTVYFNLEKALTGALIEDLNFRINMKNGSVRYCNLCASPVFSESSFTGVRLSIRDITTFTNDFADLHLTRKKAEDIALKYFNNLRELNKAQEVSKTGSWKWYIKEGRLEWSDEMFNIFGVEKSSFTGNINEVIMTRIHPEDQHAVILSNSSVIEKGIPEPLQYRILLPDGTIKYIWAEAGELIRNDNSEPILLTGIIKDLTEQKLNSIELMKAKEIAEANEDKYRMFIANTSEGISLFEVLPPADILLPVEVLIDYIYDHASLTECNNAFLKMYGVQNKDDMLGRKLIDFHSGRDNISNREEVRRFVRNGFRVHNEESQEMDAAGQIRYFSNNSIGIVRDGFLVSIWGTQTDITSLREKEAELLKAKEKAEESNRLKTAFLNNMSHEIRTPLNGIVGFSQMLASMDLSDEKRKEYSAVVSKCSSKLIDILTDVTEMSKIQTDRIILNNAPVNIADCILSAVLSFRENAKSKNIRLSYDFNIPEEKKILYADNSKLKRIVSHLLDNALKFTLQGSVVVSCSIEDNLLITVADTGIGIAEENRTEIFEPFRQIGDSKSEYLSGNGLGLSIVKAYVKAMNGHIHVDSSPGKGTNITISLPVSKVNNEDNNETKPVMANTEKTLSENQNRILIAEDEDINFIYLREILHSANIEILHARNGKCAVDICRENSNISLVLMDLKMPVLDGNEAAKQIREFRPGLPIIAHTAYTPDNSSFPLNLFDDYVPKPARVDILRSKLMKYINL